MNVVSRKGWGARSPKASLSWAVRRNRYKVHHTALVGKCPEGIEGEKAYMRSMQNYHMDTQGWTDIGYNFCIGPSGTLYEGRGHNRRSAANGNFILNSGHMAIAVMEGDACRITEDGKVTLAAFLAKNAKNDVAGHRDGYNTTCPGNEIYNYILRAPWEVLELADRTGYFSWLAWYDSLGLWNGKGRKEKGRQFRPDVRRTVPVKWWVRRKLFWKKRNK